MMVLNLETTMTNYRRQITGYTFFSLLMNMAVFMLTTATMFNVGAAFITLMIIITTLRARRRVYRVMQTEINKLISIFEDNLTYMKHSDYSSVSDIGMGPTVPKTESELTKLIRSNLSEARRIRSSLSKLTYGNGFVVIGLVMNISFLLIQLSRIAT